MRGGGERKYSKKRRDGQKSRLGLKNAALRPTVEREAEKQDGTEMNLFGIGFLNPHLSQLCVPLRCTNTLNSFSRRGKLDSHRATADGGKAPGPAVFPLGAPV